MTLSNDFFEREIIKLASVFSDKAFSQHRVGLISKYCRYLEPEQFVKIVDDFISTKKFAPLPVDFMQAAREIAPQKKGLDVDEGMRMQIKNSDCGGCAGAGRINCNDKKTGVEYLFRCKCKAGDDFNMVSPAWPKWNDGNLKTYNPQIKNPWGRKAERSLNEKGESNY